MSDVVLLTVQERIACITLNRPAARNALNSEVREALATAMSQVERNPEVDVIVLTGVGKAFCAGMDLKEVAAVGWFPDPAAGRFWPRLHKPMIGAINGAAVTGGLELALTCDFLIASEDATFADTHTQVGLVPFWGMSVLLPRAVGVQYAREMSLTGRFVGADDALRMGLVNRVVPSDRLLPEAMAIAASVVTADQSATRAMLKRYSIEDELFEAEIRIAKPFFDEIDPRDIDERRLLVMERSRQAPRLHRPPADSPR
jgi:enoyl-CoA hydratase